MESVIISQLYYPSSLAPGADVDWNVVDWSRSRYCCCLPKVFQGTQQPSHSIPLACTAITFVTFSEVSEVVKLSAPPRTAASNLPSILLSWHLASLGLAGPGDLDVKHEVVRARSAVAPICAKSTIPKSYPLKVLSDISRFSSSPRSDVKGGDICSESFWLVVPGR